LRSGMVATSAHREPEKTALFQVIQQHLLTFGQEWSDKSDGRTLPSFVTGELHDFPGCGILARGLAQTAPLVGADAIRSVSMLPVRALSRSKKTVRLDYGL
jgi:hypothetical protein